MNEQTATKWRDCADPDELAAAVAAGVEVLEGNGPAWPSTMRRARDFAECIEAGTQYWLPDGWSPEPPADDLREHLERCVDSLDQFVRDHDDPGTEALAAIHEARQALGRGASPTASPAPPWPGAVLSGCVDEDGAPTWLAQAPNVQGEAVRTCVDFPWFICGSDNAVTPHWVEVRAPRAVPEPETERVPWYRAPGRRQPGGDLLGPIVQAYPNPNLPGGMYVEYELPEHGTTTGNPHRDPDGTVEVLKDGGQ